ncbi:MAG: serine dehydratase subunit alpha family protein [Bacteroidales bacterium]|nr:serine dehydratase subunit alpha family protein [Bacteroidales bacterium]
MEEELVNKLNSLLAREVVLATGCTEPVAVALCVAYAKRELGSMPEKVEVKLSKNVYKNAMGVGIPGTGMIGLPIAISMAVTAANPDDELRLLSLSPEQIEFARQWLANNGSRISISVAEGDCDKLYIEVTLEASQHSAKAIIACRHTNLIYLAKDGVAKIDKCTTDTTDDACGDPLDTLELSARMVYDYATTADVAGFAWLKEAAEVNAAASAEGMKGLGLSSGKTISKMGGDDTVHTIVARTVAASDARMSGCKQPVYSNSGSGNQGITCTLPVYYYAQAHNIDSDTTLRALALSNMMSIYIKRGIGRLSALCGIVNATIGVCSALVYLQGGSFEQIGHAIKNQINSVAGLLCDGAKPSCALKMATGLYSAFVAAALAMDDIEVAPTDGLAEVKLDNTIRNLVKIGHDGMDQTDDTILDIMIHKELQ